MLSFENMQELVSSQLLRESDQNVAESVAEVSAEMRSIEIKPRSPGVVRFASEVNHHPNSKASGKLRFSSRRTNGARDSRVRADADDYSVPSSRTSSPSNDSTPPDAEQDEKSASASVLSKQKGKHSRTETASTSGNVTVVAKQPQRKTSQRGRPVKSISTGIKPSSSSSKGRITPSESKFSSDKGHDDSELDSSSDAEPAFDFGEGFLVLKALDSAKKIQHAMRTSRETHQEVRGLVCSCENLTKVLENDNDPRAVDDEFRNVIDQLNASLDPWESQSRRANQDIYTRLLPTSLQLLEAALLHYCSIAPNSFPKDLDAPQLQNLIAIVTIMVNLPDTTKETNKWKFERDLPKTAVHVIRKEIIPALHQVLESFMTSLDSITREAERQRKRQKRRILWERKERRLQAEEDEAVKRDVWHTLHAARLAVEPDPRHYPHLQLQDGELLEQDCDANGMPFERVRLFTAHAPGQSRRMWSKVGMDWTDEEIEALLEGLERYAGKDSSLSP